MTDLVTLQGYLSEALVAKHKLLTGQMEASVSYEGKSVSFTQADAYRLDAYIASLNTQIAQATNAPTLRGPVQFVF